MTGASNDTTSNYAVGASRYAVEVAETLWPSPWRASTAAVRRGPGTAAHRSFYLFPSRRRPRMLVPVDVPAAASMLERLGAGRSPLSSTARKALVRSARSRLFRFTPWPTLRLASPDAPSAESVESYLAAQLGQPVRVGIVLGTPRVNRKPVLQIFAEDGGLLGYAKVGHNPLTASLVAREAEALAFLNAHRTAAFRPPLLLHAGEWHGMHILVMSALTGRSARHADPAMRVAAMHEVAALDGIRTLRLSESRFWADLVRRRVELADAAAARRLEQCMTSLLDRWGHVGVQFGCWHGDWGHWNMALDGDVVQVWDWERFDDEVPVGFDALHHEAQDVRPENKDLPEREMHFLRSVPEVLAAFHQPPEARELVLALYLAEISIRYVESLSHAVTPRLQRRAEWSMTLLEKWVGRNGDLLGSEGAS